MKLVERMPRVCKAVIKAQGGNVDECQIKKYSLIFVTLFWLLHESMCYFVVLMSSLLLLFIYNVENSFKK
jgi:hypothetical protein